MKVNQFNFALSHCLKIPQNVAFEFFDFWHFYRFNQNWPVWKHCLTESFVGNVEWDFSYGFQTPCLFFNNYNQIMRISRWFGIRKKFWFFWCSCLDCLRCNFQHIGQLRHRIDCQFHYLLHLKYLNHCSLHLKYLKRREFEFCTRISSRGATL